MVENGFDYTLKWLKIYNALKKQRIKTRFKRRLLFSGLCQEVVFNNTTLNLPQNKAYSKSKFTFLKVFLIK